MTTTARPTGVTILAILAAIGGIVAVLGGITLLGVGTVGGIAGYGVLGALGTFGGLIVLALGVLWLYVAWGAWNLKPWAWTWLAVVAAFNIVVAIFNLRSEFFQVVLNAVILYYLFRPGVKAAFGRA